MQAILHRSSLVGPAELSFLNERGSIASAAGWNDPRKTRLWLYNLHYFDDLNAVGERDSSAWRRTLIDRWIAENQPGEGIGWEPYPLSLRIANWIKWTLAGADLEASWIDSLAVQVRWLERRIEWHLLGNHLLANSKALILAGLFFEGPEAERWLDLGSRILGPELDEQILADGGHFERSPMYHAIILEDFLDLWNASLVYGQQHNPIFRGIAERIGPMRSWLEAMTHPDGEIAFFNDAAIGVASKPKEIGSYADRLGSAERSKTASTETKHLPESGYVCVDREERRAILDIAPIGPGYLPGHAHADTLSFELSAGPDRLVVNGGTSTYEADRQRQRERGTAAHSTVVINGEDSSEVWAAFRVARRARVKDISVVNDGEDLVVSATHDGYRRLPGKPVHRRTWKFTGQRISVKDEMEGSFQSATARYHLGPGVTARLEAGSLSATLSKDGQRICEFKASVPIRIEPSEWHPEFGVSVPIECVDIRFSDSRTVEAEFVW